jgi:hypothetical protein
MINIQSYGLINKNNKDILEWKGTYNSIKHHGELDVTVKKGKKTKKHHYKMNNLDKQFPIDILGFNPVKKSLDQRLEEDLLYKTNDMNYEPLTLDGALIKPRKRNTNHKKIIKKKVKKTRKSMHKRNT